MSEFISIVIPTYNRLATLEVVLPSLLRQNFPAESYEIILVDSGSTDGTPAFVESLKESRIRFFAQENRGRSGARNRGIEEARGDLILFTDADIIPDEDLLAAHAGFYHAYPGAALVGCEVQVDSLVEFEKVRNDRKKFRTLHRESRKTLSWLYFLTGNVLVEKKKLQEVGMFDESFTGYGHEDLELGYRLQHSGVTIRYNPEAINFHWHPVEFDEQCRKMKLAGSSTVRFYKKHRDPMIKLNLGMTPLSLGIHSFVSPDGWLMRLCQRKRETSRMCRDIVLQYHYICGIKETLGLYMAQTKKG